MPPAVVGEFFGTLVLILMGTSVVAGCLLGKSKSHNAGWIVITAGWACAVTCGIFTAKALGGPGSLNPVGQVVNIVNGKPLGENLAIIAAQMLGAMAGASLTFLHYLKHWQETPDAGLKLAVFCTSPAIRSYPANLMSEIIATFALVFAASAIGIATLGSAEPAFIGVVVWGVGLCLGGPTGYAINPARDLGPRIAHFLLPIPGKGSSDWAYSWVPVLGPCIGAVIAAKLFDAVVVK